MNCMAGCLINRSGRNRAEFIINGINEKVTKMVSAKDEECPEPCEGEK